MGFYADVYGRSFAVFCTGLYKEKYLSLFSRWAKGTVDGEAAALVLAEFNEQVAVFDTVYLECIEGNGGIEREYAREYDELFKMLELDIYPTVECIGKMSVMQAVAFLTVIFDIECISEGCVNHFASDGSIYALLMRVRVLMQNG